MAKVTKDDRDKTGNKPGQAGPTGAFPVNSRAQAVSALKLAGHGSTPKAQVYNRVARWARAHNDQALLEKVKEARSRNG